MAENDNRRPYPPVNFTSPENYRPYIAIIPANEVYSWVSDNILMENGSLHNEDHFHLHTADIAFMWASNAFEKRGRVVLGQCEEVMLRAGGWQKSRMEQQMHEWFGRIPKFIITLAADYCEQCNDLEFCALVEHELFHIAQKVDEYGAPKFTKEGLPVLTLRDHDVNEFIGVVERYGAGAPDSNINKMIKAAQSGPTVSAVNIARSCGTCLLRIA